MRNLLLSPVLLVTLGLPGLAQATKVKAPRILWDGEWRLLAAESDKVDALIEEAVKDQNFAAKLLWKRKLQTACQTYLNLDILLGAVFSVTFGKELPVDTPVDGTKGDWKRSDGEKFQVSMQQEDTRITQTLQGDGYALTNEYTLSKDGQSLALQVTYANPKRSTPFSYKLAYRKAD
jgi:hypothetical protein